MPVVNPKPFPLLMSVGAGNEASVRAPGCRGACGFVSAAAWHHRRLVTIESDPEVLLELLELAVTWPELEYSETPTIAPEDWMSFVESHRWADPDRVERLFSVATDIARTAVRATRPGPRVSGSHMGPIDEAAPVVVPHLPVAGSRGADLSPVMAARAGGIVAPSNRSPRRQTCISVGEP
jgi:hypothetical protein